MEGKKTKGRCKLPLDYRTEDPKRRVTLCKRKQGLYKKAEELAKLCGVEIAVIIIGDNCNPSHIVATGSNIYNDMPNLHRVTRNYSNKCNIKNNDDNNKLLNNENKLSNDEYNILEQYSKQLESQRREIEQLRRRLNEINVKNVKNIKKRLLSNFINNN